MAPKAPQKRISERTPKSKPRKKYNKKRQVPARPWHDMMQGGGDEKKPKKFYGVISSQTPLKRENRFAMPLWHVVLNTRPAWLETSLLTGSASMSSCANEGRALRLPETRLPPESLLRGWARLPHGPQDYGRALASAVRKGQTKEQTQK